MSDFFIGEIRLFTCKYAPTNWHFCDGTLLPVNQYQALFTLIGTQYGGNGTTTFALPDLRGRVPVSFTNQAGYQIGNTGGAEGVTLTANQVPAHNHYLSVSDQNGSAAEPNDVLAVPDNLNIYTATATPNTALTANSVANYGGNQAHNNMQPSIALNFCIALIGLWPPRS